jgi:hypothetical protein
MKTGLDNYIGITKMEQIMNSTGLPRSDKGLSRKDGGHLRKYGGAQKENLRGQDTRHIQKGCRPVRKG